ncbi:MAG: DUF6691 family protein [Kiritimatiellia bacterium]|jgi:uncharacterized membrane protein YedE/YeeE
MNTGQILGLVTGILFGFLLQKARVVRFDKQVDAMLFRDMTIVKFMGAAIVVGMIGVTILVEAGLIKAGHKPMNVGAILVGASLFGIGWALVGFCPGTSLAALGEGRWHAIFAVIGMMLGAAVYAEIYPWVNSAILSWKDYGKAGLDTTLGVSRWVIVAVVAVAFAAVFRFFEKKGI